MTEDPVLLIHCNVRPLDFYGYIPEQLNTVFIDSFVCGNYFHLTTKRNDPYVKSFTLFQRIPPIFPSKCADQSDLYCLITYRVDE